MKYNMISTGSKGNALLLDDMVLIDCGVSYKQLEQLQFKIVLLTHVHQDHFKRSTVARLAKERPLLRFGCPDYLVGNLIKCGVNPSKIDVFIPEIAKRYRSFSIKSFGLLHDVQNVGYHINLDGFSAAYITDTGSIDHLQQDYLHGCDYYFLEANYREDEMEQRIMEKLEDQEFIYESRVVETHLSEEQAVEFIQRVARPDSIIVYVHQHEKGGENGTAS